MTYTVDLLRDCPCRVSGDLILALIGVSLLSATFIVSLDNFVEATRPYYVSVHLGCSLQHRLYVTNLLLLSVSQLLDLGLDPQVEFIDLSELFQEQVFLRWVHSLVFIRY